MSKKNCYKLVKYREKTAHVEQFIQDNGSVFQTFAYLNSVGENYVCLAIEENEIILAALPLVKSTKNMIKAYHIPPHTHIFGPVVNKNYQEDSYDLIKRILQALPNASHYDFKVYNNGDILPYLELGFSVSTVQTHILNSTLEYTINSISKNKKQDINKLIKLVTSSQLSIIENENNQHKYLVNLYNETSKRAGFKPQTEKLISLMESDISFYSNIIKDSNGNAIAGTYCPSDNNNLYHVLSLGLRIDDKLLSRANYLSLFYAINFANRNNLNFDFEGSSLPGVAQFYRMMGGQPMTMLRTQKSESIFYQFLRFGQTLKTEFIKSKK